MGLQTALARAKGRIRDLLFDDYGYLVNLKAEIYQILDEEFAEWLEHEHSMKALGKVIEKQFPTPQMVTHVSGMDSGRRKPRLKPRKAR